MERRTAVSVAWGDEEQIDESACAVFYFRICACVGRGRRTQPLLFFFSTQTGLATYQPTNHRL
jgi:hypothetical protein